MRSKTFSLGLSLLFAFATLYAFNTKVVVGGSVLYVPSPEYPTIQSAVDAAAKGDTILVAAGIYYENLEVNQTVSIIGENKYTTIIDGQGKGIVIDILRKDVYISGFTIRNGGSNHGIFIAYWEDDSKPVRPTGEIVDNIIANNTNGVYIDDTDRSTVVNNTFINNTMAGVGLSGSSLNNISRNTITESTYGMRVSWGTQNTIFGNTILNRTTSFGIYLAFSTDNVVSGNNISSQHRGIYIDKSDNNIIDHNTITDSAEAINLGGSNGCTVTYNSVSMNAYGIRVMSVIGAGYSIWVSTDNFVKNNIVTQNDWAIELFSVINNTFIGNWISANKYGVYIAYPQVSTTPNIFYYNNFIDNKVLQVYQPRLEIWDDGGGKGNYWSDYAGLDDGSGGGIAGDGIGDTELPHQDVDNYPFMNPWSEHDIAILSVTPSKYNPYWREIVNITVQVKNIGWANTPETFEVQVKYDNNVIETQSVIDLAPGASVNLEFTWNTTGATFNYTYTITAEASIVQDELNMGNNIFIDGEIFVKIRGDVNGDGRVNMLDLGLVNAHWYPGPPIGPLGYDENADINNDGAVNMLDAGIISANWTG